MTPLLAVVGQPNKGKSSIVATLAEDESIAISNTPGTTRKEARYTFFVDREPLYTLVDTPGFQRARAVLDWLRENETGAHERANVVAAFVEAHLNDPRFADECELLRPLLDGAGILYVVDGTKPYGPEYEIEMEVLRWTGRPRMALINLIGDGDYVDDWRAALGQYFSIVRVFDALQADFERRVDLLSAFAEIELEWQPALQKSIAALSAERVRRRQRSASIIADAIGKALAHSREQPLSADRDSQAERMEAALRSDLRGMEERMRGDVQALYRHSRLDLDQGPETSVDLDLFNDAAWQLFGLSRKELLIAAAVSGAMAGGAIDLVVGGASLMLGAGIGAAAATAGVIFGAGELAKIKVLGTEIGGEVLQVGPIGNPNFAWVLVGRAWLHHRLVSERNHAVRSAASLRVAEAGNLVDRIPTTLRNELAGLFGKAARGRNVQAELATAIAATLDLDLTSDRNGAEG